MWYVILINGTVMLIILASLFTDCVQKKLTYKAWLPYDYTPTAIFYFTYIHQLTGLVIAANINVACDSLISALLQQICCQIEILEYRLTKISRDEHALSNCVCHHDHIYKLVCIQNDPIISKISSAHLRGTFMRVYIHIYVSTLFKRVLLKQCGTSFGDH